MTMEVNKAAMKQALDAIGASINMPTLFEVYERVYAAIDAAESRGYITGFSDGEADMMQAIAIQQRKEAEDDQVEIAKAAEALMPTDIEAPSDGYFLFGKAGNPNLEVKRVKHSSIEGVGFDFENGPFVTDEQVGCQPDEGFFRG